MDNINDATAILVKNITDNFLKALNHQVNQLVTDSVKEQLKRIDVATLSKEYINSVLTSNPRTFNFPDRSIPGSAVNPEGMFIRPESIIGGTHRNFESTGIQDKASQCQVTILDNATVYENTLVANELHVATNAIITGNLNLGGTIPADSQVFKDLLSHSITAIHGEMANGMLSTFRNQVLDEIQDRGIPAGAIKVKGGHSFINDTTLAPTILNSNLQTVGALKELQVIGETLLDETVYISNNRVGINTMDPEAVLDIWDQEVEVTISKLRQDTAQISMPRNQTLIFGANKQNNLAINPDGSVSVTNINIGGSSHSSSAAVPGNDAAPGSIVWNIRPDIGSPVGWVSLGGARWAKFGTITV
jgi:hypothetical protein